MLVYCSYGICITPCPNSYYGVLVALSVRAGVLLLLHLLAGSGELYAYTADLLTLDLSRCPAPTACSQLSGVQTPLVGEAWEAALAGHPDRAFARYVTRGISRRVQDRLPPFSAAPLRGSQHALRLHAPGCHPGLPR